MLKKDGFSLDRRGYKYDDHGLYVASREKRKRIFIPLTDNKHYDRQLRIKLKPEKKEIEIFVPINVRVRKNEVTGRRVGVSFGLYTMLVTDDGQEYGTEFGKYQNDYADWLRAEQKKYGRNMQDNPGRIKYLAKQSKKKERLRSYIGEELNRFLEEEKPSDIFILKLPQIKPSGFNKVLNRRLSNWQRNFIINKLMQKCEQRDIRTYFVFGKGIGTTCSECSAVNEPRKQAQFICKVCGYQTSGQINSARNTLIRGIEAYEANNVH